MHYGALPAATIVGCCGTRSAAHNIVCCGDHAAAHNLEYSGAQVAGPIEGGGHAV